MSRLRRWSRPRRTPAPLRRALLGSCLVLLGFSLPGCERKPASTISRQRFVDTYVQLVQARIDAAGDSVAYAAKRDRVFLDARLEPADLRAYVAAGHRDPLALRDAWQAIAARLDTLYGGVTSRPPPGLRDALSTRGDTTSVSPRVIAPGTPQRPSRAPVARPADSSAIGRDAPGAIGRGRPGAATRPPDVETPPGRPAPIPADTLEPAAPIPEDSPGTPAPALPDTARGAPGRAGPGKLPSAPSAIPRDSG